MVSGLNDDFDENGRIIRDVPRINYRVDCAPENFRRRPASWTAMAVVILGTTGLIYHENIASYVEKGYASFFQSGTVQTANSGTLETQKIETAKDFSEPLGNQGERYLAVNH